MMPFMFAAYLTMPFVGLYFSLRCRNFISAFLQTLATVILLPLMLEGLFYHDYNTYYFGSGNSPGYQTPMYGIVSLLGSPTLIASLQLIFGGAIARRLFLDLKHRNFAFSRAIA